MAGASDPPTGTIVVGNPSDDDYDEDADSSIADDASFDAYGEDDDSTAQELPMTEPAPGDEEHTGAFGSPARVQALGVEHVLQQEEALNNLQPSHALPDQSSLAHSISDPSSIHEPSPPSAPSNLSAPHGETSPKDASKPTLSEIHQTVPESPASAGEEGGGHDDPVAGSAPNAVDRAAVDADADANARPDANDIQKLVDVVAAQAASSNSSSTSSSSAGQDGSSASALYLQPALSTTHTHQMSLPPKPAQAPLSGGLGTSHPYPASHPRPDANAALISNGGAPSAFSRPPDPALSYPGAPGTLPESFPKMPPPPVSNFGVAGPTPYGPAAQPLPNSGHFPPQNLAHQIHQSPDQAYESFIRDEQRYTREAKWERFPDGSRVFIGNLSQERVSKRDVWDLFHKHGRLAQISLKAAYGFVQYHTVDEAKLAMVELQGAMIRGREIHLEESHRQKKEKGRDRSPNRGGNRAGRNDRFENRDHGRRGGRDDYRPGSGGGGGGSGGGGSGGGGGGGRDTSSRQNDHRHARGDRFESGDRSRSGRSRSPNRYSDPYRQRSPSPHYDRNRDEPPALPPRYGSDVPDVQLVVTQDVERNFIAWVQKPFHDQGLRTDVMFLNTRSIPKEVVTQRMAVDGVHATVELDFTAQATAKVAIQVFDRSQGSTNVSWNMYQNLDPPVAAELARRAKTAVSQRPAYPPANSYGQPYQQAAPHAYTHSAPHTNMPPAQAPPTNAGIDLSSLVGQIDNATLQHLLASMSGVQPNAPAPTAAPVNVVPHGYAAPAQPSAMPPNIDINALLGNLRTAANGAGTTSTAASYGGAGYAPPSAGAYAPAAHGAPAANPDQMVQSIMSQLANFRQ